MTEVTFKKHLVAKKHSVLLYDSITDLPVHQFSKMQKYQLIESGIGSNIAEFDSHLDKATEFLKHDQKDKAIQELKNMRQLFWHNMQEVDPSHLAFCCLIHSIDGEIITDYSEKSLEDMRKQLSDYGLTQKIIAEQAVKKNSKTN